MQNRIGVIGICGWGGMALNAAAIDTRIKATVTSTMYNMSEQMHNGYQFAPVSGAELHKTKEDLNAQRTADAIAGNLSMSEASRRKKTCRCSAVPARLLGLLYVARKRLYRPCSRLLYRLD